LTKARDLANLLDSNGDVKATALDNAPAEVKPIVSSVSPSTITNDPTNIVITGQNFTSIPKVDIINTATGIWYSSNTVTFDSATQLTVNVTLPVDANTFRIRVENPDGLAGLSGANFLTTSDAPVWTTGAGSLGSIAGDFSGTVATVAATGDTVVYSEVTNVLTNASLANCTLNSSTGAITTSDFDGASTSARTHTFTLRATDAQGQTTDRQFSLTSAYSYTSSFLIVAGGGGSGSPAAVHTSSGGGGAGGYRSAWNNETSGGGASAESALTLNIGTVYTITVGGGGTGGPQNFQNGSNGGDSSIAGTGLTTITSLGGGYGGNGVGNGNSGGSGGGAGSYMNAGSGGAGTAGQGYAGTSGSNNQNSGSKGGGGGGASAPGSGVNGGGGRASTITGSSVDRAGGGASTSGSGGTGGGANGNYNTTGNAGQANTGGGGGGTYSNSSAAGGAGGSGVVILRVPAADYSGTTTGNPTVSDVGSDKVLIFNATGSYTG
jgi:hypothetical protein